MSQRKQQVPAVGLWPLFQADVLSLAERFGVTQKVAGFHRAPAFGRQWLVGGALQCLVHVAVNPHELRERQTMITPAMFAALYRAEPDFTIATLALVRRKWRALGKSKRGRIQQALATRVNFKADDAPAEKDQWSLGDCQLAGTLGVETADVVKARKKLRSRVIAGSKLANKLAARTGNFPKKVSL